LVIGDWLLVIALVIGDLAIDGLAIGYWRLAIGDWVTGPRQ
jgi:hypothetical protein